MLLLLGISWPIIEAQGHLTSAIKSTIMFFIMYQANCNKLWNLIWVQVHLRLSMQPLRHMDLEHRAFWILHLLYYTYSFIDCECFSVSGGSVHRLLSIKTLNILVAGGWCGVHSANIWIDAWSVCECTHYHMLNCQLPCQLYIWEW